MPQCCECAFNPWPQSCEIPCAGILASHILMLLVCTFYLGSRAGDLLHAHTHGRTKHTSHNRHVLKRAATTGEELSSMCEQGAVISKALDYLQALAAAPDDAVKEDVNEEEDEEGPNMQGRPHEGTGAAEDSKEIRQRQWDDLHSSLVLGDKSSKQKAGTLDEPAVFLQSPQALFRNDALIRAELSIEYDFFSVYQAYVQRLRSRAQGRAEVGPRFC
eukprot:1160218-Pelagomonas_calceolata.AAC.20